MTTGAPTEQLDAPGALGQRFPVFASKGFVRLFIAQVVSATGDWLGFLAILITAARVGGGTPEAAVGLVTAARIVPGFFLGPIAGVLVDRWNRKKVMVTCDLGRAAVLCWVPFVDTVYELVIASLLLEAFTLMWSPAKEASVPNLVARDQLTAANSLSLIAAYGTFPIASGLFILLARLGDRIEESGTLSYLRIDEESLGLWVDVVTFLGAAALIATISLPARSKPERTADSARKADMGETWRDLKEGWSFIFADPTVRAVNVALATGLIGGGMLVPLGPVFSTEVLDAGPEGFGWFITALGVGVAIGVVLLTMAQQRIKKVRVFTASVFGSGVSLMLASSMWTLAGTVFWVGLLGVFAGAVYVLGFTLLHEHVADEFRGRIFSALYTLVRMCLLVAFAIGPFLAVALNGLSEELFDKHIEIFGSEFFIPGVRLTLWLAGLIIIGAGFLALMSFRAGAEQRKAVA